METFSSYGDKLTIKLYMKNPSDRELARMIDQELVGRVGNGFNGITERVVNATKELNEYRVSYFQALESGKNGGDDDADI